MLYCVGCGTQCPQKILVCPQCGAREFAETAFNQQIHPTSERPTTAKTSSQQASLHATQLKPARHFPRFGAVVIDYLLILGLAFIVGFVVQALFDLNVYDQRIDNLFTIIGGIVGILYLAIQHSGRSQATVGKRLLGLKICMADGGKVSFGVALWRAILPSIISAGVTVGFLATIGYAFGAISHIFTLSDAASGAFGILVLLGLVVLAVVPHGLVFVNRNHKTLFDIICSTRVVEA